MAAECEQVGTLVPPALESFMHQFFSNASALSVKKEVEEVEEHVNNFSSHQFSPDENAATSSERDESPDTVSHCDTHADETHHNSLLLHSLPKLSEAFRLHSALGGEDRPGSKIDGVAEKLCAVAATPSPLMHNLSALSTALAMQWARQAGLPQPIPVTPAAHSLLGVERSHVPSLPVPPPQHTQIQHAAPNPTPKRKRQRRNPVWPYFIVEDGLAKCKQCAYSTRSVFSTNLKVHLRSHHRADYEKVIEAEDQLNLNALLLSGNAAAGVGGRDSRKRSLPPMTSSILMTISKLAAGQTAALQAALASTATPSEATEISPPLAHPHPTVSLPHEHHNSHHDSVIRESQSLVSTVASSPLALSTPSTPLPPTPTPSDSIFNQLHSFSALHNNTDLSGMNDLPQPKRRRLRRHPVWMYFKDLEDRMVGCINCNFRTGSAFSTNLKMHLKAHHKDEYAKVLKLEDDMRMEEGIQGAPNKMKTELIDFIRGGGNASTPMPSACSIVSASSPLLQQLMAGKMHSTAPSPTNPSSPSALRVNINNNTTTAKTEDESLSSLSMSDRLAALVGLGESDRSGDLLTHLALLSANHATRQTSLSASALSALNSGSSAATHSDSKSCTSSSVDGSSVDDRKSERDRALATFASTVGDDIVTSHAFKELVRVLAPDYEVPEMSVLDALMVTVEENGERMEEGEESTHTPSDNISDDCREEEEEEEESECAPSSPIHQLLQHMQ